MVQLIRLVAGADCPVAKEHGVEVHHQLRLRAANNTVVAAAGGVAGAAAGARLLL
ncbi:hypothetical protein CHLRE_07g341153v5 [Chlamydomonas reinhardtii]|uniref:Uncharacterized protein n=1 Tax=Chlamydomonas reinhardtii TaxID=3055 RepID=A0A2K3DKN7_CHLRE|nr:uncharacterized protein CHLRE_07g341153v5 [Chlamydomonas reinhardtii]PNW81102.1 hypothetical protein CHLRE_07g341153v5 [Chlamydomonas reinhardtii]